MREGFVAPHQFNFTSFLSVFYLLLRFLPSLLFIHLFGSQFHAYSNPDNFPSMATNPYDSDPPVDWYGTGARPRPSRPAPTTPSSLFRCVLIIINYFPSIEDIQAYGYKRVIDNALQEPPHSNPWLLRHVIFTIGETVRSDKLIRTTFAEFHETLTTKIFDTWRIRLPDDFFTFRFKASDGQIHDIPLDSNLYWMLEFHRPGWNRVQHTEDNSTVPFVAGLTQPYILRLTAHRSP